MNEYTIMTYGLTEEQNQLVKKSMPSKQFALVKSDCATDLIAIASTISIIHCKMLSADDKEMLIEYHKEVNGCSDDTVIWIDEEPLSAELKKVLKYYPSFETIQDNLRYLFLTAQSKQRTAKEFSRKLTEGLLILSWIRKKPGITTKELSEKAGISLRATQRSIAALKATGEWIDYNRNLRGWELTDGISILFGDI